MFFVYFALFLYFFCLKGSELIVFHGNRPPLLLKMPYAAKAWSFPGVRFLIVFLPGRGGEGLKDVEA